MLTSFLRLENEKQENAINIYKIIPNHLPKSLSDSNPHLLAAAAKNRVWLFQNLDITADV